jgi:2,3-bisphosphoglycerate-independent phosphoglycerate mutase
MMKYVVIIPDGLADRPIKDFDGKTPVEVARTPHLDRLAKEGKCGLARNVPKAMPAGSDVACLSLLGYNPEECYSGRGPLEAASKGIILKENQYAFRCNLVTIFNSKMIDYSGGHISSEEGSHLIDTLREAFGDVEGISFYSGVSYRNLAIINDEVLLEGKGELRTVAPHDILNQDIEPHLPEGKGASFLIEVMKRSENLLEYHEINKIKVDLKENPANSIWLWGQGRAPAMPSFESIYGLKGSVISAVDLIKGISVCAGMKVIEVPGATGYLDTDYAAKGRYAIEALKDFDLVFVHIEAPDEAGHNGNKHEKVQAIEQIDEKIIGPVAEALSRYPEGRMLVSPDHPTPIELRTHTRDAVPFVLWGTGVKADKVQYFSEFSCRSGKFGVVKGHELIKKVLIGKG